MIAGEKTAIEPVVHSVKLPILSRRCLGGLHKKLIRAPRFLPIMPTSYKTAQSDLYARESGTGFG